MKKIIVLIASVCFMASSAFASPVATVEAVQTAVKSVNATSTAMNGVNAAAVTAAVANSPALGAQLESLSAQISEVAKSNDDAINGLSKVERVKYLADLYAASVLTKDNYDVVERLFKGKPLQAILGQEQGEDALDGQNLAKFQEFLGAYTTKVADMDTQAAAEAAAQEVIGKSFADLLEACGAAAGRN